MQRNHFLWNSTEIELCLAVAPAIRLRQFFLIDAVHRCRLPYWTAYRIVAMLLSGYFKMLPKPNAVFRIIAFPLYICGMLIAGRILASPDIEPLQTISLPPGFSAAIYGGSLGGSVTSMQFAPDGRLFVCLQEGPVRIITNGTLLEAPFVVVPTKLDGERGLGGIAFDPDFASNQFVYFYYTVPGPPAHNRVSRFTADGDTAVPGSETVILDLDQLSGSTSHNGGAIHFGADGNLYVAVGDNRNPANSQTVANRLGKMLRIHSDGTIPEDNPTSFPGIEGTPSGPNRAIWAVGLRNPFTFAVQPGTGRIFINDVGEGSWEEINDGIAGSNYGWDLCEGVCVPPDPTYTDPIFQYIHGGVPTAGCAITGGAFYNPPVVQFPASYVGKYFFSDLCISWIRLFDPETNTASGFAQQIPNPVDLKVGADGNLYCLSRGNNGQVFKIQYVPPTPTPTPTPAPAQTLNISTRLNTGTDDNLMIGGFIVRGTATKSILLRGIGPSLIGSGVPPDEVLLDPVLELRGPTILPIQNDNWRDGPAGGVIKGTIYQPGDDREAVLIAQVPPGSFTALLTGKNQTTGVGLVEVYDFDQAPIARLANVSTRGLIQTEANVMIGGFILGTGGSNTHLAIRGLGPSLAQSGLSNVLADPTIELHDGNGALLIANDNWQDDPISASELTFLGLALPNPNESGISTTLPPGSFSVILAGKENGTGLGLIEIYNLR